MASDPRYRAYRFTAVVGRAKENVEGLMRYNSEPNIDVLYDVANMPELMSACDVAVTSRGRTGYELAILGVPSIAMAQNAREEKHGFVCNENGFAFTWGSTRPTRSSRATSTCTSASPARRARFQDMLLSHDLRGGRKRVMALISSL